MGHKNFLSMEIFLNEAKLLNKNEKNKRGTSSSRSNNRTATKSNRKYSQSTNRQRANGTSLQREERGSRSSRKKREEVQEENRIASNNKGKVNNSRPKHSKRKSPKRQKTIERFNISVISIILVVFCLYVGSSILRGVKAKEVPIITLKTGSVSIPKEYKSLIVRNETVYTSPKDGKLVYEIIDGEKVAKNSVVSYITDEKSEKYYEEANKQFNSEDFTIKSLTENYSGSKEYIQNLNRNVKDKVDSRNYNSFSDFYALINNIEYTVELRNSLLLASSEGFDEQTYNENIIKARNPIYSINSGIVSYAIDGNESIYTFESFDNISKKDTLENNKDTKVLLDVNKGDEIFKVIEDNTWYVVSYITNDVLDENNIIQGEYKKIYLNDGVRFNEYNSKVFYVERNKTESKVVFEIEQGITDLLDLRNTTLKVDKSIHSGIKIPLSALKYKDTIKIKNEFLYSINEVDSEKKAVYLSKPNGEIDEIIIDIHRNYENEGYSEILLATTILDAGDILVKKDDSSKELQIPKRSQIQGLLVINSGVAIFREVYIDENAGTATGVAILKIEDNPNIREYDQVIEDTSLIEEGEVIY